MKLRQQYAGIVAWGIELLAITAVAVPAVSLLHWLHRLGGWPVTVIATVLVWELGHFAFALLVATVLRLLPRTAADGRPHAGEPAWAHCHLVLLSLLRAHSAARKFLSSPGPQAAAYRAMGLTLGRDAAVSDTVTITEPHHVSIGDGAVIGFEVLITPHITSREGEYWQRPVVIGAKALVGARSTLWPGVVVGEGATVLAGSIVNPDTVIPPGEVWGGAPARRIRAATSGENDAASSKSGGEDRISNS